MTRYLDLDLTGDKELLDQFDRLRTAAQRQSVEKAAKIAMKPVLLKIRAEARKSTSTKRDSNTGRRRRRGTGKMARHIKLEGVQQHWKKRRKKPAPRGLFGAIISTGTREELGIKPHAKGYYPISQEFGFRTRRTKAKIEVDSLRGVERQSVRTGLNQKVSPRWYMAGPFNRNRQRITATFARELGKNIDMNIKKGRVLR